VEKNDSFQTAQRRRKACFRGLRVGSCSFCGSFGDAIEPGTFEPHDRIRFERVDADLLESSEGYRLALQAALGKVPRLCLPAPPERRGVQATGSMTRGKDIFEQQGCAVCHTPPLYTNNQLTPAEGFVAPDEHRDRYDVMSVSVHTDSTSTLKTRRGTGYYKVPSLKGVWYRGPLRAQRLGSHSGRLVRSPAAKRRLHAAGDRGYGMGTRAVKGHMFGLGLSPEDRKALIAFLKTL
jgi:Cytochrome c